MATVTPARRPSVRSALAGIAPAAMLVLGMVAAVNILIPQLQAGGLQPSVSQTAQIKPARTSDSSPASSQPR
jgi:hypothetical protein